MIQKTAAKTAAPPGDGRSFDPLASGQAASQGDQAYFAIEERIATLKFKPGEVLTELGLSALLEFGRTPIREALQRLEYEGLVTIEARRGATVTELDVRRQLQMLEVRRCVERYAVIAAAKRASYEDRQQLAQLAVKMRQAAN